MEPRVIGITGGIGSGKSLISRIFSVLGIPVYVADDRAKWLIEHDPALRNSLTGLLGPEAYLPSGAYNRAWVASRVFDNPALLGEVNARVHPRVQQDGNDWTKLHANAPYLLYEAAIMKQGRFDKIIVVEAPEELRIKRVKKRDGRTEDAIRSIIARQASPGERSQLADYIIHNDDHQPVLRQVLDLDAKLRSR